MTSNGQRILPLAAVNAVEEPGGNKPLHGFSVLGLSLQRWRPSPYSQTSLGDHECPGVVMSALKKLLPLSS